MVNRGNNEERKAGQSYITTIHVEGFKSLVEEQDIALGPLTVLAGANSSGKSSVMQAVLLLKQTLESAPYDPGPLKLNGENVRFTRGAQFFSRIKKNDALRRFEVGLTLGDDSSFVDVFEQSASRPTGDENPIQLIRTEYSLMGQTLNVYPDIDTEGIRTELRKVGSIGLPSGLIEDEHYFWREERDACFRIFKMYVRTAGDHEFASAPPIGAFTQALFELIHVPGLRGNPQRSYDRIELGAENPTLFPGTFDRYVFSLVYRWQARDKRRLERLNAALKTLGLAYSIEARMLDETQGELLVSRLPEQAEDDQAAMVSIADVGFGVSQVLPAVMALLAAKAGQLVYIEQPEIHLHPKAQIGLANLLAQAVEDGVRLVVETHSSLLVLAIRKLVAEGSLSHEAVKLHWFTRNRTTGVTKVTSDDLDEVGAFDGWPEDFGATEFALLTEYVNAVNKQRNGNGSNGHVNGSGKRRTITAVKEAR